MQANGRRKGALAGQQAGVLRKAATTPCWSHASHVGMRVWTSVSAAHEMGALESRALDFSVFHNLLFSLQAATQQSSRGQRFSSQSLGCLLQDW